MRILFLLLLIMMPIALAIAICLLPCALLASVAMHVRSMRQTRLVEGDSDCDPH